VARVMPAESDRATITMIAGRHGIAVAGNVEVNDVGLDFRVAFVTDQDGREWVLRIPRRPDVWPRAENERGCCACSRVGYPPRSPTGGYLPRS